MNRPMIPRRPTLDSVERDLIALIGCGGFNVRKRLVPELALLNGQLDVVGFDICAPDVPVNGVPWVHVRNDRELADWLAELAPRIVLIETPDDCHAEHIRLGLRAHAELILCEKCIAATAAEAQALLDELPKSAPTQQVRVIDHYLLFKSVLDVCANATSWLGEVSRIRVTLFESQGVPRDQERSHAAGMAGFIQHAVALAGLWFDLDELVPVEAAWARHLDAKVPDTYRAIRLCSARTGNVVLEGSVGKHMLYPRKLIEVMGTNGRVVIDRDANTITCNHHAHLPKRCIDYETGYAGLVQSLAEIGVSLNDQQRLPLQLLPHTLLSPYQAVRVLELIEQAQTMAVELPQYPTGREPIFEAEQLAAVV